MDEMVNRDDVGPVTESGREAIGKTKVISSSVRENSRALSSEELGNTRVVGASDDNLISDMEKGILNSLPIEVLYPQKEEVESSEEMGTPVPPPAPEPVLPVPPPAPESVTPVPPPAPEPRPLEKEKLGNENMTAEDTKAKPVKEKTFLSSILVLFLILTLMAGGCGVVIGCCVFNTGIVREILRDSDYAALAEEDFKEGLRKVAVSCQAAESSVDDVLPEGKMAADIQLYVGSMLNGDEAVVDSTSIEEAFIEAIDKDYASRKLRINEEGMATLREVAQGVGGLYTQAVTVPGLNTLAYLREHFSVILALAVANLYALSLVFMTMLVKLRRKYRWGIAMIWYAFIASALVLGGIPLAGLITGRYGILAVQNSVMTTAMKLAIRTISIYMVLIGAMYVVCGIITTVIFLTRREGK